MVPTQILLQGLVQLSEDQVFEKVWPSFEERLSGATNKISA